MPHHRGTTAAWNQAGNVPGGKGSTVPAVARLMRALAAWEAMRASRDAVEVTAATSGRMEDFRDGRWHAVEPEIP